MSIRSVLALISESYPAALNDEYANHPVAQLIRTDFKNAVSDCVGETAIRYIIKASAGSGKWTTSPWAAILDPIVTSSAEGGYYPVFLFSKDFSTVSLVMGQGTSDVRKEFGARVNEILSIRAELLRQRVPEFSQGRFHTGPFDIQTARGAGGDWGITSAWGVSYPLDSLPSDEIIAADVREMLKLYHIATARGGFDLIESDDGEIQDLENEKDGRYLDGQRRERLHKKIERLRNGKLIKKAKAFHGEICKGCGLDFSSAYGPGGQGYVEAHHLVPLSALTEDAPVALDPKTDFTVLCANCHRMIHRLGCPSLTEFRAKINPVFVNLIASLKIPTI